MKRSQRLFLSVAALLFPCFLGIYIAMAAEGTVEEQRSYAHKQHQAGNYRNSWEASKQLVLNPTTSGEKLAEDLQRGVDALRSLQRQSEIDEFLSEAVELHSNDWRLMWKAARLITEVEHYGFVVAGDIQRGNPRGSGSPVDLSDRDRVQSLIWYQAAMTLIPDDTTASLKGEFFLNFAQAVRSQRDHDQSWRLQQLTDLSTLPEVEESSYGRGIANFGRGFGRRIAPPRSSTGAPVDDDGNPIFYNLPSSFEEAKNDGERWRWCLNQAMLFDPARSHAIRFEFASFLSEQFGVETLQQWEIFRNASDETDQDSRSAIWSLQSLNDNETIARLANGIQRFSLPDEFNFIKIFREIAAEQSGQQAELSLIRLGNIYENRLQFPKAAAIWEQAVQRFPKSDHHHEERLKQITGNWGQFETTMSQVAGRGATVDFRFRNGKKVQFTAQILNVSQLLNDVKDYLKSNPTELDWSKTQIDNIGYRLVQENETKYLGEQVAQWSLDLDPREAHFDRRISVTTPVQKGGAYLLTSQMEDGNISRVILWLNDTAIVEKPMNGQMLYFVADAATGEPVAKAHLEFFGWNQKRDRNRFRVQTKQFAENTNAQGYVIPDKDLQQTSYQWLVVAKTDDGRFAHLGFQSVWGQTEHQIRSQSPKVYVITDRPVYRPDQKVQFKIWVRDANYDDANAKAYANQEFLVRINDAKGTEVSQQKLTTDEFGGISGEYALPEEAALGQYQILLAEEKRIHGAASFRVEEYKKPEFEVLVEAPTDPVQLGDKVTATIRAKYYYGAPVSQGTVSFKVERSQHDSRWFPVDPWDWLYGNGYWWFTPEAEWYPGFSRWGCLSPTLPWRPWRSDPPELVIDQELPIGSDGTVQVEIDTSLAKALFGDKDQEYTITAEVTDASRRTIVGTSKVLVSKAPYQIFTWTSRGFYQAGQTVEANFQARTLAGKGVQGTGILQLLKITYGNDGPVEQVVEEWSLETNEGGYAQQKFRAADAGQYRLSFKMKSDIEAAEIEGGQIITVRGDGFDGSDFQFNDLEVIANQKNYAPGDQVKLLINTNRIGSTVLVFLRSVNSVAMSEPQVIKLNGKSTEIEVEVSQEDFPNFFIDVVTVSQGKLHNAIQEIHVPPQERVLNVKVVPSAEEYPPGQQADVEIQVTDVEGNPFEGSLALTVYDRAVEYISGGSNVQDIREFFWKWKRSHYPRSQSNLAGQFWEILKENEVRMASIGLFGQGFADFDASDKPFGSTDPSYNSLGRSMGGMGGGARMMMQAAPAAALEMADSAALSKSANGADAGEALATPQIRSEFADTAFWKADLKTDAQGIAKVTFDMPENLSAWKLRAWGMGHGTAVGEGTTEVVTSKNLIVRLQAPRFFTETDEVVLSAVVHNQFDSEKNVRVELELEGNTLNLLTGDQAVMVVIPAGGETRVDWRVKATAPGLATVTMKALTNEESDAMKMTFPVNVHGTLKTESYSRVIRGEENSTTIEFTVPEDRQPAQSRLEVRFSPSVAAAMVDALPYLVDSEYRSTEQTLNRFLPTVITNRILQRMGLDLKAIQEKQTNLNAQQIGDPKERAEQWKRYKSNPVFDNAEVEKLVKLGVADLSSMQNSDGGWGWFSGYGTRSYAHTTAVVVHGLQLAVQNDIALVDGILKNGVNWLKNHQSKEVELLKQGENESRGEKVHYKTQASEIDALVFSVLVDGGHVDAEMQRFLYRDRLKLSLYSQTLIGLALHKVGATTERDQVIENIDQFIKTDEENQTAFIDLPTSTLWWYWYGNRVEANAHYLKLLSKVNPDSPIAAGLAKYLINNRRSGYYWNNTRDTAYCIEALAEYLTATNEHEPNMQVEVWLNGELKKTVEITKDNLFSFDNSFVLEGEALTTGDHVLEIRRKSLKDSADKGSPLYINAYQTNFTTEEFITAAGLEIQVQREFYRLIQDKEATQAVPGQRGQVIDQSVTRYRREKLENLSAVQSGDLIEIELTIDSKNDYEYILIEDFKAAGCEPVDLQSGYTRNALGAYVEFRDEKVAFFVQNLGRGKHSVSYRVRAEIPGQFSALPAKGSGVYAPELRANSDEMKLSIQDNE